MVASLILSAASTAGMLSGEASQSAGDGPTGDGGEISTSDRKKLWKSAIVGPVNIIKILNKMVNRATGVVGINLSVASLLRQSQFFTSTVGAFFQIMGAFLDKTLAPLMPGIMKGLSWMAEQLPKYANLVTKIVTFIEDGWKWLKELFNIGDTKDPKETPSDKPLRVPTRATTEREKVDAMNYFLQMKSPPVPKEPPPLPIQPTPNMQYLGLGIVAQIPPKLPPILEQYIQTSQLNSDLTNSQKNSVNSSSLQVLSMMASTSGGY
tara:strand:+ start:4075 stop:4869 length:795 start_codon:yes stop_codon:yes gene_type:complete